MTETLVGLPQTNAAGLSERWLFQHCGDQHWRRLCAALGAPGVTSERLRDEHGHRLYPTFIAVRGRYSAPLSAIGLDDRLHTSLELSCFGRAFVQSRVTVSADHAELVVEMLTAFAARAEEGRNGLHMTVPATARRTGAKLLTSPPLLLALGQSLRHGELRELAVDGHRIPLGEGEVAVSPPYEPSPYSEFNGAGLLYFAAYPTIADALERQILKQSGLANPGRDWSTAASTIARDVFYHRNLDLGGKLEAHLLSFQREGRRVALHTQLTLEGNGAALADLFTVKELLVA